MSKDGLDQIRLPPPNPPPRVVPTALGHRFLHRYGTLGYQHLSGSLGLTGTRDRYRGVFMVETKNTPLTLSVTAVPKSSFVYRGDLI